MEDLNRKRNSLLRIIEQGGKLESLYSNEDFKFFLGWIDTMRAGLEKKILTGKLIGSLREEDHAKGGYAYMTTVIEAAQEFKDRAVDARKKLIKLDEQIKDYAKEEGLDLNEPG